MHAEYGWYSFSTLAESWVGEAVLVKYKGGVKASFSTLAESWVGEAAGLSPRPAPRERFQYSRRVVGG